MPPLPPLNRPAAFTLVELLTVIAIIVLLVSMAGAMFRGGGASLPSAAATLAGLIDQTREMAILKRQPTALAMLGPGSDAAARVFFALEYERETATWRQISRWETLPAGVVADTGKDSTGTPLQAFFPAYSPKVDPALPGVTYQGKRFSPRDAAGYGYVVFLPDGSLYQDSSGTLPASCVLRLVEGVYEKGAIRRTGASAADGSSANYVEIALNRMTGQAKVSRP